MSITFIDYSESGDSPKISLWIHRSKQRVDGEVKLSCCGKKRKITDYKCIKRDIFPLKANICESCDVFEM